MTRFRRLPGECPARSRPGDMHAPEGVGVDTKCSHCGKYLVWSGRYWVWVVARA